MCFAKPRRRFSLLPGLLLPLLLCCTEQPSASAQRLSRAEEPEEVCAVEHEPEGVGGYRGQAGAWAVWADSREESLFACHLDTGVVRRLGDLGPEGSRSVDLVEGGVLRTGGEIQPFS